jgi:uncharacterized protein YjcR
VLPKKSSPEREIAFKLYKESKGKKPLVDIAKELNIKEGTVRGWKNKDKWGDKIKGTFLKNNGNVPFNLNKDTKTNTNSPQARVGNKNALGNKGGKGASIGNQYAIGNKGGTGGPLENKKAVTTGEFETIYFHSLTTEEETLINYDYKNNYEEMIREIKLLTIREHRMLKRIKAIEGKPKEMLIESITKTKSEKDNDEYGKETFDETVTKKASINNDLLKLEEALTRIQALKHKKYAELHKQEMDKARLLLDGDKLKMYKDKLMGKITLDSTIKNEEDLGF